MKFEWIMDPYCVVDINNSYIEIKYTFKASRFITKCLIVYKFSDPNNLEDDPEISMYGGIDLQDYTTFPPSSCLPSIETVKKDLNNYIYSCLAIPKHNFNYII